MNKIALILIVLLFLFSCANNDKGIDGNNNDNNTIIQGNNNVINSNTIPKYKGKTTTKLNDFIKLHEGEIVYLDLEFTLESRRDIIFWEQEFRNSDNGIQTGDSYDGEEDDAKEWEEGHVSIPDDDFTFRIFEEDEDRLGSGIYGVFYYIILKNHNDYIFDNGAYNSLFLSGNFKIIGFSKAQFEALIDCKIESVNVEDTK